MTLPREIFAWEGFNPEVNGGSWHKEPCSCDTHESVQYVRRDATIPNTTILMFIMGFQGGTVHQVAERLQVSVSEILNATPAMMENLMRSAQTWRRKNDPMNQAAKNAFDVMSPDGGVSFVDQQIKLAAEQSSNGLQMPETHDHIAGVGNMIPMPAAAPTPIEGGKQ